MRKKTSKWIRTFAVLLCLMLLTGSMPMTATAAEPKAVPEQTPGEDGIEKEQDPETGDQTGEEDSSAENRNGKKEPSESDLTVEEYPDEKAADSQAHEHNDVHFEPWNSVDSLPSGGGSYYLTEDVTLTDKWTLSSGTLNLCLNGHTICGKGHSRDQVISIEGEGTVLNLYDDGGGTITQENCSQASLVVLSKPAVFNMYGGTLRGAVSSGVRVLGGDFTVVNNSI